MGEFPSGQRGQTVNLLRIASMVRIRPPPQKKALAIASAFFSYIRLAASYIGCASYICFASDIGLRPVLEANIISLKRQVSISHFA